MNWTEIKIIIKTENLELASAIANMAVPYGIYIEDYSDLREGVMDIAHVDLIDSELLNKKADTAVIHIYINECDNPFEAAEYLKERLTAEKIDFKIDSEKINDSDWNENWKKYFKAFTVGEKLAVCPSWESYENEENRKVINLDPGAAFGTGGHATTYLCMTLLEKYVNEKTRLLDIGTGSGILSISALLLGAQSATGVDIDELSVKTAKENAQRNGVEKKCDFLVGDLAQKVSGRYNIICANIVADVIIKLLENVKNYMEKGAKLIVSGIIDIRKEDVEKSAKAHGFKITEHITREEWHAYVLESEDK